MDTKRKSYTSKFKAKEKLMDNISNLTRVPFAPYLLMQNDRGEMVVKSELTLRDVMLHTYVRSAATWLLGYLANCSFPEQLQARYMPLRAQQMESPFEVAWSVLLLLKTTELLGRSSPELTQEIYRKIPGAVSWLLNKAQDYAAKERDRRANWEVCYDTAIVTNSLLRTKQVGLIPENDHRLVSLTIKQALSWLGDISFQKLSPPYELTQQVIDDLTFHSGESLAMMLSMIFTTCKVSQEDFINTFFWRRGKLQPAVLSLLDDTIAFVEKAYQQPTNSETQHLYLPVRYEILIALADVLIENHTQKLRLPADKISRIRGLLIQSIETLESSVLDFHLDTSQRADRLTTYIKGLRALAITDIEDKGELFGRSDLILGHLRGITHSFDPFGDGSTYHSLHATWHTFRCFLEVCYWSGANQRIIKLYDDQLKIASVRAFTEQKQFYQLQRRLIDTEQQLAIQKEYNSNLMEHYHWTRRGFITILVFLSIILLVGAAMPLLHFGHLTLDLAIASNSGEGFITLIIACVGLAGSIGYVIDRLWSRRQPSNTSD